MKQGIRILALEDSPIKRNKPDSKCLLVGVVARPDIIEGVLSFNVTVDGDDSTQIIINKVKGSRFYDQIRLIAINGNTVAGMNVVDIGEVSKKLKMPLVAITRKRPHPGKLKLSIKKACPKNYKTKAAILERTAKNASVARIGGYYVQFAGAKRVELRKHVSSCADLLRLAHIIASGISSGESRGRL